MKLKLENEFTLPEETYEFETYTRAAKYRSVLLDLDIFLRGQIKYAMRSDESTLQEVRDELRRLLIEEGIDV